MRNAVIVHGTCDKTEYFSASYPSLSNSHWLPWLQKQMLVNGIFTQTPEMPNAYMPVYEEWKKEFERFDINEESILIGHSCGGGFLLRWLSQNKVKIDKLVLVAPWLDPNKEKTPGLFEFDIDQDLKSRINNLNLLYSENDTDDVQVSVKKILDNIQGVEVSKFKFHGHFTYGEMLSNKFPELLNIILDKNEKSYIDLFSNLMIQIRSIFS